MPGWQSWWRRKAMATRSVRTVLDSQDVFTLTKEIRAGLPYHMLREFQQQSQLPLGVLSEVLQIPPRTLARRKVTGRLTSQESERLLRLVRLYDDVLTLF